MIRVKRVVAPALNQLEETVNSALAAMEEAGQEIMSVQLDLPAGGVGKCSAFIVFNDQVGLQEHGDGNRRAIDQLRRPGMGQTQAHPSSVNAAPRGGESVPRDTGVAPETVTPE